MGGGGKERGGRGKEGEVIKGGKEVNGGKEVYRGALSVRVCVLGNRGGILTGRETRACVMY